MQLWQPETEGEQMDTCFKLSWGDPNQILLILGVELGSILGFSDYSEASSKSGVFLLIRFGTENIPKVGLEVDF